MSEWTPEARDYLEGYLIQVGALARSRGEDADDITSGLRDHVAMKLAETAGPLISLDVLNKVLSDVGTPQQVLSSEFVATKAPPDGHPVPPRGHAIPAPIAPVVAADRSKRVLRWAIALTLMFFVSLFGLSILSILLAIGLPAFARARVNKSEMLAVPVLKRIAVAEQEFRSESHFDADGDGVFDYGTLDQLLEKSLIEKNVMDEVMGYNFNVTITNSKDGGPSFLCQALPTSKSGSNAHPLQVSPNGDIEQVKL